MRSFMLDMTCARMKRFNSHMKGETNVKLKFVADLHLPKQFHCCYHHCKGYIVYKIVEHSEPGDLGHIIM